MSLTGTPATAPPAELASLAPYPGLDPFTEPFRPYFVGRRRDTELLVSNLFAAPLTILYGASGVGKTSVILAGIVPRVHEDGDAVIVVHRTWQSESLVRSLGAAMVRAVDERLGRATGVDGSLPMDRVVAALAEHWDGPIFLMFDQFEEYFLYPVDHSSPDSFDAAFARAVNRRDLDVHVMISLREDALSGLDRFRHRIPSLLNNLYRLEHLSRQQIHDAIVAPLATLASRHPGVPVPTAIEESLPELIVADQVAFDQGGEGGAPGGDRFVTPFLQLVLRRLWDEELRAGSRTLRTATFERLGRSAGVVSLRIREALAALTPREQDVAASVLRYLVTPTGGKVALGIGDLEGYVATPAAELRAIAVALSGQAQRILRGVPHPSGRPEMTRYEIFHDALARPLLDWRVAFDRTSAERAAVQAAEAERRAREAERRRRLATRARRAIGATVALLVLVVGATWGWRRFSGRATARALAAHAAARLDQDRPLSLLLALEALSRDPDSPEGDVVLRRALFEAGEVGQVRLASVPRDLVLSPDGAWLMTRGRDDTTHVIDTRSLRDTMDILVHEGYLIDAVFTPDSRYVAALTSERMVRLFDLSVAREVSAYPNVCEEEPLSLAMTAAAAELFVVCMDGAIRWWGRGDTLLAGGRPVADGGAGIGERLLTSIDGRRIVSHATGDAPRVLDPVARRLGAPLGRGARRPEQVFFAADGRLAGVYWAEAQLDEFSLEGGDDAAVVWLPSCAPTALDVARTAPIVVIGCNGGEMAQAPLGNAGGNIAPGGRLRQLRLTGHAGDLSVLEVSDDGRIAFSVGPDGAIVWDLVTRRQLRTLRTASGTFLRAVFLRDNARLATVSSDGLLQLWALDPASRMFAAAAAGHLGSALSPADGRWIAATNEGQGARIWRSDDAARDWFASVSGRLVAPPAFAPDGERLALLWSTGAVAELELEPPAAPWRSDPSARVAAIGGGAPPKGGSAFGTAVGEDAEAAAVVRGIVSYSASGDVVLLATFARDRTGRTGRTAWGRIRLFDRGGRTPRLELDSLTDLTHATLSPDARAIAAGFLTGEVRLFDLGAGRWIPALAPDETPVATLAYRPDGALFVARGSTVLAYAPPAHPPSTARTSGADAPMRPGTPRPLRGTGSGITALAFSPTTGLVAAGDSVGGADVWDATRGAHTCALPALHADRVTSLSFAPSGVVLASGSADRTVAVASLADGACRFLYRIQATEQGIASVAFRQVAPPFLVVSSVDGTTRRYERALWAPRDSLLALAQQRLGGRVLTDAERREYLGARR